jgi:hypothetical protein
LAFCKSPVVTKNSPLPALAALIDGSSMTPILICLRSRGLSMAAMSGTMIRLRRSTCAASSFVWAGRCEGASARGAGVGLEDSTAHPPMSAATVARPVMVFTAFAYRCIVVAPCEGESRTA